MVAMYFVEAREVWTLRKSWKYVFARKYRPPAFATQYLKQCEKMLSLWLTWFCRPSWFDCRWQWRVYEAFIPMWDSQSCFLGQWRCWKLENSSSRRVQCWWENLQSAKAVQLAPYFKRFLSNNIQSGKWWRACEVCCRAVQSSTECEFDIPKSAR